MSDWRLDSSTGCDNLPISGVVCASGILGSNRYKFSGGGFGSMTWMPLEKVCDDHIVVQGGRVLNRGFAVDREGMAIRFDRTIPEHVQFYVIGLGAVRREREREPWYAVSHDLDSMFPTPKGIRFGYHPYQEQLYGPGNEFCAINRRFSRRVIANSLGSLDKSCGCFWCVGRIDSDRFLALGYGNGNNHVIEWNARTLERRILAAGVVGNNYINDSSRWTANMFPNSSGDFYQMPRAYNAPVVKWGRDGTKTVLNLGLSSTLVDPDTTAPSTYIIIVHYWIRLFDGRALGFPAYYNATYPGVFALFDPEAETMTVMTYADLGLTVSGTTRWKDPVQGRDGKVYALPGTFPGNLTLVFDPATLTATQHDFGIAYPNASVTHSGGIATADNRIVYMQTGYEAVDTNSLLILDLSAMTHRVDDLGIAKSLFDGPLIQEFMTGDGACVFVNASASASNKYQGLVYNWATGAYKLFRNQNAADSLDGMSQTAYTRLGGGTSLKLWNDRGGCVWHKLTGNLTSPNFIHGAQFFESPPVSYPGPYERLMYYGGMM